MEGPHYLFCTGEVEIGMDSAVDNRVGRIGKGCLEYSGAFPP